MLITPRFMLISAAKSMSDFQPASSTTVPVSWAQSVIPVSAALIIAAELINLPRVLADAGRNAPSPGGASH